MSTATQYRCGSERRRAAVRDTVDGVGQPVLNGIDFLEVVSVDQCTLALTFVHPLPGETDGVPAAPVLTADNIAIDGGVRVKGIKVTAVSSTARVLTVKVDRAGDFSSYTLRVIAGPGSVEPPNGFDPFLGSVQFSFKAACQNDFDCAPVESCPPDQLPAPLIDYLAKDYASFRRLMLDRLATTMPGWTERNASDIGVTLVEVLAYAADHLSYHQDAVATEAYLGTARLRTSVRRHAKLLDYPVSDGASARAWVVLDVDPASDGVVLPGPVSIEDGAVDDAPGTLFFTRTPELWPTTTPERATHAIEHGAQPFEALHSLTLRADWSTLQFYTWSDEDCCLPRGATRAWLRNPDDTLAELEPGRVLVFEEVRGAESGRTEDLDPAKRHAVRLVNVTFTEDLLFPELPGDPPGSQRLRVACIEWAREDALPFPMCLRTVADPGQGGRRQPVSVARGNVVLVEHGSTFGPEELPLVPMAGRYRPMLSEGPVARQLRIQNDHGDWLPFDPLGPATGARTADPRRAMAAVRLRDSSAGRQPWLPAPDLIESDAFDREFVVESEDDGRTTLRFGDGQHGRRPTAGASFTATYRVGGGSTGNVGADAIAHVAFADPGILSVRNPLPAIGGEEAEPNAEVRLYAPQAFRSQERAVTEADYANAAQRHPEVQRAAATFRWTGSWHTVFLTVDRLGALPVDADFEEELVSFLEPFPLAGFDLEIEPPRFVPLDIAFTVCVARGHLRADVEAALLDVLSSRDLPDGRRGFFHPDNFTFGDPVYLSRLVATVMSVAGVVWVDTETGGTKPNRFQRWGLPAGTEWQDGMLRMARLEIARLDNDPSLPENGRLELFMVGGL